MSKAAQRRVLEAGEWLFREGDEGDNAYLIEGGMLEVIRQAGDQETVVGYLNEGEIVGEMSLIDELPRSASIRAAVGTTLRPINSEYLQSKLDSAEPMLRLMVKRIIRRLRENYSQGGDEDPIDKVTARDREQLLQRIQLEQELRAAVAEGQLTLYYQPIVDLEKMSTAGFEALIRWNHPTRGMVSPVEFIPIAEDTNLIVEMGRWILFEGCAAMARMQPKEVALGDKRHFMSINLSGKQLNDPGLGADIRQAASDAGVRPQQIKLEITESLLLENWESAVELLNGLREDGFRISVDDFGTGYSSLSYLNRFPVDTLKIDQSFVANMMKDAGTRKILRALGGLARDLGMDIIAEGIEEGEQASHLYSLGFEFGQGYFFSKPVPEEQAAQIVSQSW